MAGETEDHRAGTNLWGLAVHQGQKDLVKQKSKVCQALLVVVLRPSLSCPSKPGAHGLLAGRLMQLSLWLSISEALLWGTPGTASSSQHSPAGTPCPHYLGSFRPLPLLL